MVEAIANCAPSGPRGQIVACESNTGLTTLDALCELFDNSIDAKATRIISRVEGMTRAGGLFAIEDNGCGMENLEQFLRLGESGKAGDGTQVGRYGVGAKTCIWTVGGLQSELRVDCRTRGAAWSAIIDWSQQDSWQFPWRKVDRADVSISSPVGSRIEMRNVKRQGLTADRLMAHLSLTYWPWLERRGNIMEVNGVKVTAPKMPKHDGRFCRDVAVYQDERRSITLEGGLTSESHDMHGVSILFNDRVLKPKSGIGSRNRSVNGVFVVVRLSGDWNLDTHKRDVAGEDQEWLRNFLEEQLEALFDDACERSKEFHLRGISDQCNASLKGLNGVIAGMLGKPRRSKRGNPEARAVEPAGTDRQVREAAVVSGDGRAKQRNVKEPVQSWRMAWMQNDPKDCSVGHVESSSQLVYLYTKSPLTAGAEFYESIAQEEVDHAVAGLLAHHFAQQAQAAGGELPFGQYYGRILGQLRQAMRKSFA